MVRSNFFYRTIPYFYIILRFVTLLQRLCFWVCHGGFTLDNFIRILARIQMQTRQARPTLDFVERYGILGSVGSTTLANSCTWGFKNLVLILTKISLNLGRMFLRSLKGNETSSRSLATLQLSQSQELLFIFLEFSNVSQNFQFPHDSQDFILFCFVQFKN